MVTMGTMENPEVVVADIRASSWMVVFIHGSNESQYTMNAVDWGWCLFFGT
jgi:hypothetical protein